MNDSNRLCIQTLSKKFNLPPEKIEDVIIDFFCDGRSNREQEIIVENYLQDHPPNTTIHGTS